MAICYRRQVIEELVWSEISYHPSSLLLSSRSEWYGGPSVLVAIVALVGVVGLVRLVGLLVIF